MIGRSAIDRPWIFTGKDDFPLLESFELFKKHILLFKEKWGESKDFNTLKKFVKSYVSDFAGSQEIRKELMGTQSIEELLSGVEKLLA